MRRTVLAVPALLLLAACGGQAAATSTPTVQHQLADPTDLAIHAGCPAPGTTQTGITGFRVVTCEWPDTGESMTVKTFSSMDALNADLAAGNNADAIVTVTNPAAVLYIHQGQDGYTESPQDIAAAVGGTVH